jgi:hypothetical protein
MRMLLGLIPMTVFGDIVWRILRISLFDSIRPKILRSEVYRLEGTTKPSKYKLSTIVFGGKPSVAYYSKLIYADEPKVEFLGKRTLSDICSFAGKTTDDLTIVEADWSSSNFLLNSGFLILPQINFVLDITGSLETIRSRMAASKIRRIDKVVNAGYSFEITKNPVKLRLFYYEMYLPHMFARHGKSARPVSFSECKRLFSKGYLMLVNQDQKHVAGVLLVPHGTELYQPLIAVKSTNKQITLGSYAATYYTIVLGMQKGYTNVDFGDAPAFMQNGLFQYKKEWGMRIRPAMGHYAKVCGIRFSKMSEAVKDFLSANPFIFMDGNKLRGLVLVASKDIHLPDFLSIPGLSGLSVISSSLDCISLDYPQLKKLTPDSQAVRTNVPLRRLIDMLHEIDWMACSLELRN